MKKGGILHPDLSSLVARLGHTDFIVLADRGYPIPKDVERINVGLTDNLPTIPQVMSVLLTEMIIDRIIVTHEMEDISPIRLNEFKEAYPDILVEFVSHLEMKELTKEAKAVVKTGDTVPYANVIIVSG